MARQYGIITRAKFKHELEQQSKPYGLSFWLTVGLVCFIVYGLAFAAGFFQ